jgi:hypothetical protein
MVKLLLQMRFIGEQRVLICPSMLVLDYLVQAAAILFGALNYTTEVIPFLRIQLSLVRLLLPLSPPPCRFLGRQLPSATADALGVVCGPLAGVPA